jgi:mannose-6-phosphate isomerase-like protein (cupin superfamily)
MTAPGQRRLVVARAETETLGPPGGSQDRFILGPGHFGPGSGAFSLVEHILPAKTLAAPLHLHANEDEYSFILEGRVGAWLGGREVFGTPGDLILKPRGEWHTFWNDGDEPARILEIIAPGGFEEVFRELHALGDGATPEAIAALARRYAAEADFEGTMPIMEKHGLAM